jgi:hypothetical protein
MQPKPQNIEQLRRKQAIYLTIAAGLWLRLRFAIAMIIFCNQSSHLRM